MMILDISYMAMSNLGGGGILCHFQIDVKSNKETIEGIVSLAVSGLNYVRCTMLMALLQKKHLLQNHIRKLYRSRLSKGEVHVDSLGFRHSYDNEGLMLHYVCTQLHEHYASLLTSHEEHQLKWKEYLLEHRNSLHKTVRCYFYVLVHAKLLLGFI